MRKPRFASPGPMTKVPTPCRVSTMPAACSFDSASRTTVRLTPNASMNWPSVGSFVPAASSPLRMRAPTASTTSSASGRPARRRDGRTSFIGDSDKPLAVLD